MITAGTTGNCKLPVGYGYAGAHTLRDSGTNKINLKNLPRGGELRKSILAPDGYVLCVADSSQIEYRYAHWLGGEQWVLNLLNEGRDPYCESATEMFGYVVDKSMKRERFVGKVRELGLDYGMGPPKFQATLASGAMGMVVELPLETCQQSVWAWRSKRPSLTGTWKDFDGALNFMSGGSGIMEYRFGIRFDADEGLIWYPNGFYRAYPNVSDWNGVTYTRNGRVFNLWGGTLMEHFCQGGCRDIVMEQALAIDEKYEVVMTTYDEIVACVKEDEADEALRFMLEVMGTTPAWAPGLPLKAEGGWAREYSK
jgi:DNA polymerase